jgi:hypothetical protein
LPFISVNGGFWPDSCTPSLSNVGESLGTGAKEASCFTSCVEQAASARTVKPNNILLLNFIPDTLFLRDSLVAVMLVNIIGSC